MHIGAKWECVYFLWHLLSIFTYTSPTVEKRSSSGEGMEAEQTITEVFAGCDMLEIQCDSHQSEIFLDATGKDRLHKEGFNLQISKYDAEKLEGKLLDNFCYCFTAQSSLSVPSISTVSSRAGAKKQP